VVTISRNTQQRRLADRVAMRYNDEPGWTPHRARREAGRYDKPARPAPSERDIADLFDDLPEPDRSIAAALAVGDDRRAGELLAELRRTERLDRRRTHRVRRPRLRARHVAGSRRR
jgi:hypothetical protein